jgi:hypothetical protein
MRLSNRQILHWLPRTLALIGVLCLSLIDLKVYVETGGFRQFSESSLPYLELTLILIAVTAIAWYWSTIGGILFIAFGYFAIIFISSSHDILIALPPMFVGLLFLWEGTIGWLYDGDNAAANYDARQQSSPEN